MNSKTENVISTQIIVLLFFCYLLYYFIIIYPSIDHFSFGWMTNAYNIEINGFLNIDEHNTPLFDILIVFFSKISNLQYYLMPIVPFQVISGFIIIFTLLRKISYSNSIAIILTLIYLTSDYSPINISSLHSIGLLIFFTIIFFVVIDLESFSHTQEKYRLIPIIILITSLIFVSYKQAFICLIFFITLQFLLSLKIWIHEKRLHLRYFSIIIYYLLVNFTFNHFVYDTFFPLIKFYSDFSPSSGFEKMLNFFVKSDNILQDYVYISTKYLAYAHLIWLAMLYFLLLIAVIYLIQKKNKQFFFISIFFALVISSVFLLIIYSLLGLVELTISIFVSFFGIAIILKTHKNKNLKKTIPIFIFILLFLNIFITMERIETNNQIAPKDPNYWNYINSAYHFETKFIDQKSVSQTDVLTFSYLSLITKINENKSFNIKIFERNDLIEFFYQINKNKNSEIYFLLNLKEENFAILGWENFKSWKYIKIVDFNKNKIFSSGNIEFYRF